MDSLLAAAARAYARGDVIETLRHVSLRDDPPALALRGVALAQLGEYTRARELLRQAARGFGAREAVARARCVVAEAEVALALRDLGASQRALTAAIDVLNARGDPANAQHARLIVARRSLLLGRLDEAADLLATLDRTRATPVVAAVIELLSAEVALRSLRIPSAEVALGRAQTLAARAGVPALLAEVREVTAALEHTAAVRVEAGTHETALTLSGVANLLAEPGTLLIDGLHRALRAGARSVPLARRPVLFALLRALAQAWPGEAERQALIAEVFRTRRPDESHRARLRVEMGRLRALIAGLASVEATAGGYALRPHADRRPVLLAPPIAGEQGALRALLSDGLPWSTSALALATDASQRTVQRALAQLVAQGQARAIGQGRARRWLAPPLAQFTTILLLPTTPTHA
ncbi:hypothetical protein [Hylemonella gracilis]|uniref:Tetratricopeptide tpr_4 protein n=1 Tax=Hylemonella gracilis ATCC 19624 TaxID=887062 RepID=F3KUQ5_9BURK|nr:hypothetical protein [Hylemonella gracilis]EGI76485.1 tetratricopeptide tpr_4 protein [Hylemonella gracilis ATCC 19624]